VLVVSPWADCVEPIPGGSSVDGQHIADLVRVLRIVHTRLQICHRDVKPWNIYIYNSNIILSDWGSARSSLSPVTWEGTIGFYKGYIGEQCPLPANDLIALLKSAYLMLFNCRMPVTEIETFWKDLIESNRNTAWKICHESCLNHNYDEFIHYIQQLK
jgi:serine/threonine protein kinase